MTHALNQNGWRLTLALAVGVLAGCGGENKGYKGKKYDPGRVLPGTVTWEGKPVDKGGFVLNEKTSAVDQKGKKALRTKTWRTGPIEKGKYIVTNLEPGKYHVEFDGFPL